MLGQITAFSLHCHCYVLLVSLFSFPCIVTATFSSFTMWCYCSLLSPSSASSSSSSFSSTSPLFSLFPSLFQFFSPSLAGHISRHGSVSTHGTLCPRNGIDTGLRFQTLLPIMILIISYLHLDTF